MKKSARTCLTVKTVAVPFSFPGQAPLHTAHIERAQLYRARSASKTDCLVTVFSPFRVCWRISQESGLIGLLLRATFSSAQLTGTPKRAISPGEDLSILYSAIEGSGQDDPLLRASNESRFIWSISSIWFIWLVGLEIHPKELDRPERPANQTDQPV